MANLNPMDSRIVLKEPFWGAGTKYKWKEDLGDLCGFGVNVVALAGDGYIVIETGYGKFLIKKEKAKAVCDKYNAYFMARGTKLAVIPRAVCEVVEKK